MEVHAKEYQVLGYTSVGIAIQHNHENNKKKITFKQLWQNAIPDTYASFFKNTDNGVAILTGEVNDLYVVDCDVLKDKDVALGTECGLTVFSDLISKNKLDPITPIQRSASGGVHYFFSLSKSFENGLLSGKNTSKVVIAGKPTSIDTRGEKGCIIASPTSYNLNKEVRTYTWTSPLVSTAKLPAMPKWLVAIINANLPSKDLTLASALASTTQIGRPHRLSTFQRMTQPIIEDQFNAHFQHIYDRENGYDGSFLEKKPCVLCSHTHRSNSYMVRQLFEAVYYIKNYSTTCKSGAFNWEDNILLSSIIASPMTDEPYAKMVREVMRSRGIEIIFTQDYDFLCFNGHYWENLHKLTMAREIRTICGSFLEMLYKNIRIDPVINSDEQEVKDRKKILKSKINKFKIGRNYLKKAGSVNNIAECYKQLYFDTTVEKKLNTNKDILVVKNGVIDLKTGMLREGQESDYTTYILDVEFVPNTGTSAISAFFDSIFNSDEELILYMQKLLGYAITGHTSEQVWCIFTGEGSNGKSLLMSIIEKLMGPYYKIAPYEVFFKSDRKTQAGGATAHLATLKGARICVKEEADPTDALNIELMKMLSGESTITSRGLYEKQYSSFVPTVLPILLCNHKPAFDVDDYAMTRRIVVVPFFNIYADVNDAKRPYDANNPRHRLRDNNLRQKLMLDDYQEQLLNWLVAGAVKWYADKGLGEQPRATKDAFNNYFTENDKLGQFIEDQCTKGTDLYVNAAEFRQAFNDAFGTKVQQNELVDMMKKRGFYFAMPKINGKTAKVYKGLALKLV